MLCKSQFVVPICRLRTAPGTLRYVSGSGEIVRTFILHAVSIVAAKALLNLPCCRSRRSAAIGAVVRHRHLRSTSTDAAQALSRFPVDISFRVSYLRRRNSRIYRLAFKYSAPEPGVFGSQRIDFTFRPWNISPACFMLRNFTQRAFYLRTSGDRMQSSTFGISFNFHFGERRGKKKKEKGNPSLSIKNPRLNAIVCA